MTKYIFSQALTLFIFIVVLKSLSYAQEKSAKVAGTEKDTVIKRNVYVSGGSFSSEEFQANVLDTNKAVRKFIFRNRPGMIGRFHADEDSLFSQLDSVLANLSLILTQVNGSYGKGCFLASQISA
jgi:hypothetical protein